MQDDKIRDFMRNQPFMPFYIRTTDGRVYEVDHPDFIARSRDGKTVSYYAPEDNRLVVIDARHIVALELVNKSAA